MPATIARGLGFPIAAVVVLGTGVWLTRAGWPFGAVLLTVHKLVALAAVVGLGLLVYRAARTTPLSVDEWALVASAALLCLASFASGGVVSATQSASAWVLWIHRIGTWFAIAAVALCLLRVA